MPGIEARFLGFPSRCPSLLCWWNCKPVETAPCLNLRLVRDVIVRFRCVYRLCLKTVLCDVWERACYLLFSCLLLWWGGVIMNWSTRAEWETRGRPCSLCFAHLTVDVAGRNFRSLLRTCSWRSSPANVLEVSYLKCSTRCSYVPFNFTVGIVLNVWMWCIMALPAKECQCQTGESFPFWSMAGRHILNPRRPNMWLTRHI